MTFLPITLGVRISSGAEKGEAGNPASLKNQTEKTLKRDDYACRFCGFRSLRYQRVIPYPDAAGNLPYATACTFCEQCVLLERGNISGSGILVWLPEVAQAELNHIIRAAYIARESKSDVTDSGRRTVEVIMTRRSEAKKRLGSDDPLLLATVMQEMLKHKEVTAASAKLDGLRLMAPDKYIMRGSAGDVNQFPEMIKYWCSPAGPYAQIPVDAWKNMFKTASSKIGNA